jgi:hypothetical protein
MASKVKLSEQLASIGAFESERFNSTLDVYDKFTIDFVAKIKEACVTVSKYIKSQFDSDLGQRDLQQSRGYIRSLLMALQDNISLLEEYDYEVYLELEGIYNQECHAAVEIYIEIKRIIEVKARFEEQINAVMGLYDEGDYAASDDCCSTILFALKEHMDTVSDESNWFKEVLEKLQLDLTFFYEIVKEVVASSCEEDIPPPPPPVEEEVSSDCSSDSWEQVDEPFRPKVSDEEPIILGRKDINRSRHPLADLPSNTWVSRSSELSYSPDGVESSCDSLGGSGAGLNSSCMYANQTRCSSDAAMVLDESIEGGWVAVCPVNA